MLGMDASGKTSILYKLKLGEVTTTIPTIGFNVEHLEHRGKKITSFTTWDLGGRSPIRPLWRHYYKDANALIFVVDSKDRSRMAEAKGELDRMLEAEEHLVGLPLLVFANKQDLVDVMTPVEVAEELGLHKCRNRDWYIQGSSALSGEGLFEGLEWLTSAERRPVEDEANGLHSEQKDQQKKKLLSKTQPTLDKSKEKAIPGNLEFSADSDSTVDTKAS